MTANATAVPKLSVLYVEDTVSQAQKLKLNLESQTNCRVHVATSGEEGLATANQHNFDLIILDVELPGMNGFEVCRRLKANEQLKKVPVIMLTTRDRAEDALEGLMEGAVDYIPKDPFSEMVLIETLKTLS